LFFGIRLITMKSDLRKSILEKRNSIPETKVLSLSGLIKKGLFDTMEYLSAQSIMFYVSFSNEVHTHEMIRDTLKNKSVIVPKIIDGNIVPLKISDFDELSPKTMGILEPVTNNLFNIDKLDLVIVPAIAYDIFGNRIGYGKGYYDRFLKAVTCLKIGIVYEFQLVESIPIHKEDIPVDKIVTEKRVIDTLKK